MVSLPTIVGSPKYGVGWYSCSPIKKKPIKKAGSPNIPANNAIRFILDILINVQNDYQQLL
jgi:hypothetical protein